MSNSLFQSKKVFYVLSMPLLCTFHRKHMKHIAIVQGCSTWDSVILKKKNCGGFSDAKKRLRTTDLEEYNLPGEM